MGMFDTIYFDNKYICPFCNGEIDHIQVKEFDNTLEDYAIKDCVSHAEDIRIIKDTLYCMKCNKNVDKNIYIVVSRGILSAIADTLEEARLIINEFNKEQLVLWYHDLYKKYKNEQNDKHSYKRFIADLIEWYREGYHEKRDKDKNFRMITFLWNRKHLQGALSPIEAAERFMTYTNMLSALDKLWDKGCEILEIYYPEDIKEGAVGWYVDVYQDEINDMSHLNWTWTVNDEKLLTEEDEKEDAQPEWVITVKEPFSDELITESIRKWLHGRRYKFDVKMIPVEEARGSGMLKKLKEMVKETDKEKYISHQEFMDSLDKEENQRMADFIESKKERGKVFYYKGLYGSLVPDVESDMLIGKIEGIKKNIIYKAKTVKKCEEKYRESVDKYSVDL
ncbi:MAG TPA: hypothetical protein VJL89_13505 [Thermodesulfovibrionia bacterium]|nr:hypothetical protein [Thermodesulfovibrionia bacterium]